MITPSNRWLWLFALALSGVLWLGISSVTANAVHVLVKSNFALRPFGSVSVWLLASSTIWPLFVGYMLSTTTVVTGRSLALGICVVVAWAVALVVLTAIGDEFLGRLGVAAIAAWVLEITIALLLLRLTSQPLLSDLSLQNGLVGVVATLAWLTAAKALVLCLSPGVTIRL